MRRQIQEQQSQNFQKKIEIEAMVILPNLTMVIFPFKFRVALINLADLDPEVLNIGGKKKIGKKKLAKLQAKAEAKSQRLQVGW